MAPRTLFTPFLALACATSGAWAGKKAFNIHDDLLAFPQVRWFQVYLCFGNHMLIISSLSSFKSNSPMNTFSTRKQRNYYEHSTTTPPPSDGPTRNKRRSTWEEGMQSIQKNAITGRNPMDRCYLTKK